MSPTVTAFGGAPQGGDDDVVDLILGMTTAPFLPADVGSSMSGWLEGTPRPISEVARRVVEGAAEGAHLVTTTPGPLTLAMAARAAAHPAYRTHLALDALAAWIEARCEEIARHRSDLLVTIVMDEPALAVFAPDAPEAGRYREVAVKTLATMVERSDAPLVIHSGEDTDWSVVAAAEPAYVGWNTTELGVGFEAHADEIARAIGDGMGIMWGVASVEPTPQGSDDVILARYRAALARLVVAGAPIAAIRDDAWFAPSGSMERLDVGRAQRVLERVAALTGELE